MPQFVHPLDNLFSTDASLSAVPCEALEEIKDHGLQNPFDSCIYEGVEISSISGRMDWNLLGSMSNTIHTSKHRNWQSNPYGNIARTCFLPNINNSRSMNMEYRHPVLTTSASSSTTKSTACEASQLDILFESPANSSNSQSSTHSLFQIGDELSAALISGFRSGIGKTNSQLQNKKKNNCSLYRGELLNVEGCTATVVQEFNSASNLHDIIVDSKLGLPFSAESKEGLLESVVAGFPSSRKLESRSCLFTSDKISPDLGSSKEASMWDDNNKGGYSLDECTLISSSNELQKSTNTKSSIASTNDIQKLLQDNKGDNSEGQWLKQKKQEDTPKTVRRRGKPGDAGRRRPKDRQRIQDHVKELRDIVPNGNKCSMDALLGKTIKYMKFLHTITQHVGRWSYTGKLKIAGNETPAVLPVGSESGASWAVDVDANGKIGGRHCPIIVENLSQPGQMLLEILCENRGIFLEIASHIRGLGLTILKGVMEVRNQHIWGHFVVEAVQDIHRVEVLWSLAHILELVANNRMDAKI